MTAPASSSAADRRPPFFLTADFLLGFMAVCLFIYVCKIAKGVMIPFVIAVFLWYLINAIARFLGRFRLRRNRPLPRAVRFFISIVLVTGMIVTVTDLVRGNIDQVIREAPQFQASFEKIVGEAATILHIGHAPSMKQITDEVMSHIDIGEVMRGFAGLLTNLAGKTVMIVFFVGFLLYEQRYFPHKLRWMVNDAKREEHIRGIFRTIDIKIQKYIGVKAFVSFLDSFLTFIILTSYGVKFAGFWGVMAFFLHFIPYAGSFVAITMPVIISLIQFGDLTTCLLVLGTLCLSHAFLGHVLDPWMMGNNLNLSPIFIISNLAMWGLIWGIPGMFLAIPILAITALTLSQFERTRALAVLVSKTGVLETPATGLAAKIPVKPIGAE